MRRRLVAQALLAGLLLIGAACHDAAPLAPQVRCEEDQPCWDCETMGNRVCGPSGGLTHSELYAELFPGLGAGL